MDLKIDQKWDSASLRIVSKTITPAGITKTLGIEPTRAYAIGTPVKWILESGLDESEPLNLHINQLLLLIESKVERFKKLMSVCDIEIFCGFSSENGQGGFVLDAGLIKRMGIIPLDLVLDLYPAS
ncbi:MAG: DUF4279 domain-containing protein [Hormoscilla sp.]